MEFHVSVVVVTVVVSEQVENPLAYVHRVAMSCSMHIHERMLQLFA